MMTGVAGVVMQLRDVAAKADVAPIPYLATKADVSDFKRSIVRWIVGAIIIVAALTFTIAKIVH